MLVGSPATTLNSPADGAPLTSRMLTVVKLTVEKFTGWLNRITIARLSCHTLLSGTLTSRTWKVPEPPPPPPPPPPPQPKSRRAAPRENRRREAECLLL